MTSTINRDHPPHPPTAPALPHDSERQAPRARDRARQRVLHLFAVLHRWAESGWSGSAVGTWAVLQGSVAPGPSDALLVPLGLADPKKAFRLAAWAITGATAGGLIAFAIGAFAFNEIGIPLLRLIGIGPEELASSRALFERRGWMLVLLSAVSPLSTKMVCMAAGAFGVPFPSFALALLGGRTARFLVVATVLRFAGARILGRIERTLGRPIESLR